MIIVDEFLALEVVDHRHQTDGVAQTVLRAGIEGRKIALKHAAAGTGAQAPLLVDDATLLVDLVLFERQSARPVAQDEQAGVDVVGIGGGHVVDVVHRLVDGREGIEVATELHADRLAIAQQGIALEVVAAVEGHVLEEVGQTALALLLLDGTHALGNVEVGTVLRPVVVPDVVSKAVGQFTRSDIGIHGQRHLLSKSCQSSSNQQDC